MEFHSALNEAQRRRLSVTCEYIDKLLRDVEEILHETQSGSPFPRHIVDLTPAQVRVIEDHIRRLREQLLRTLAWQRMKPDAPDIPATRAALTHLSFIDIAIEELKPGYMRGTGAVPEKAVEELNGVVHELRSIVQSMERYFRQELGTNLEERLKKLERQGQDVALLRLIEEIVTRHGLVEFRPRVAGLTARLEDNHLEAALFGRVNCGKSSLLNALLDTDVLPVGVNPITAVPTRLRHATALRAAITFADGRSEECTLEEFRRLITEQGNPGNRRNVTRALVESPSPRLREGIVLVDTPGLGSLARHGAAETMAYLPACDLALVLIDAGSSLNDEDIGTLRILTETGIPSLVLLSKCDLLAEGDLKQVVDYIEAQLQRELGIACRAHPVSAMRDYSSLLDHFFAGELQPRFEQARVLREASVARKIGALRESAIAALETSIDRESRAKHDLTSIDADGVETELRHVSGEVGEQKTVLDQAFFELGERPEVILAALTDRAVERVFAGKNVRVAPAELAEWARDAVQAEVNRALDKTRSVMEGAIDALARIAKEMKRTEMPSRRDAEALLRGVPMFEVGAPGEGIDVARQKWMGRKIVCGLVRRRLEETLGVALKDGLHRYGRALGGWTQQMTRRARALVNSYADAQRAQLNRMRGTTADAADVPEMERDLARLLRWDATKEAEIAHERV
jgi:GTP-binding protein EngB required for normal cell division